MDPHASAVSDLLGGRRATGTPLPGWGEVELRILDSAAELVAAIGLHATIDTIAKRAGVGRATVYRYFDSKDAVLGAMARREIFEEFTKIASRTAGETDARAKAIALYASTFEAAVTNPILRRIALDDPKALLALRKMGEPMDVPTTIRDALKGALDDVRAQAGLEPATHRAEVIADTFVNTVSGYLLSHVDLPDDIAPLAKIVAEMSVEAGLVAEP